MTRFPKLDLRILPFLYEAALGARCSHCDPQSYEFRPGQQHLLDDERTHGKADDHNRGIADFPDEGRDIVGVRGDRPGWRAVADGAPGATRIETCAAVVGKEAELFLPFLTGLVSARTPDNVRPGSRSDPVEGHIGGPERRMIHGGFLQPVSWAS